LDFLLIAVVLLAGFCVPFFAGWLIDTSSYRLGLAISPQFECGPALF
jgi:hypothetical protein